MALLPKTADRRNVASLETVAAELRRFNNLIERYLDGTGVPAAAPSTDSPKQPAADKATAEVRDEWEIAIDEEKTRRREAEEREIADRAVQELPR